MFPNKVITIFGNNYHPAPIVVKLTVIESIIKMETKYDIHAKFGNFSFIIFTNGTVAITPFLAASYI